ncbi:ankyrin repeat-containing domain protein, partial [Sphaerosporella brunnea]
GLTPLHCATASGYDGVVLVLIENGADVSAASARGLTPLHCAVAPGREQVAALLIAKGADVSAVDGDGRTPLRLVRLLRA